MTDSREFTHDVNEHIRLVQRRGGLTFGTDAYLLAAYVRPRPRVRAVDLGSGTGIIPLLCLARNKAATFVGVELQAPFCDIIEENARQNGMEGRLTALCRDVRALTAADVGGEVGLVTANPPYMKADSGKGNDSDEKNMARRECAGTVADFCAAAGRILQDGGRFMCVFRPERAVELFCAMRDARLEPKRMTQVQAARLAKPSMILVEAVKGAAPGLRMTPALCLWRSDEGDPGRPDPRMLASRESDYIYANCTFPDAFSVK